MVVKRKMRVVKKIVPRNNCGMSKWHESMRPRRTLRLRPRKRFTRDMKTLTYMRYLWMGTAVERKERGGARKSMTRSEHDESHGEEYGEAHGEGVYGDIRDETAQCE